MPTHTFRPFLLSLLALAVACGPVDPSPVPDDGGSGPEEPADAGEAVPASVTISGSRAALAPGESRALSAVVRDADGQVLETPVSWLVDDETVATVTVDGVVSALSAGDVVVSAIVGVLRADVTLVVVAEELPVVVRVALSPESFELLEGQSLWLVARAFDSRDREVEGPSTTWTSDDASVAQVTTAGEVVAVKEGATTIRATVEGVSAAAEIKVNPTPIVVGPVATLTIQADVRTLAEGEVTTLVATPRDASGQVVTGLAIRWQTSDEHKAFVTAGGVVTGVGAGAATITASVHRVVSTVEFTITNASSADLLYAAAPEGGGYPRFYTRDIRDPDGAPVFAMPENNEGRDATPSPDGTRLAFAFAHVLRIVERDGTPVEWLEMGAPVHELAWSPDGNWIAFRKRSNVSYDDVWVVRADGTGATNLTEKLGSSNESFPAWSPTSVGRIAYTRIVGGESSIWTMAVDGTDHRPASTGIGDRQPSWSPDGTKIVFQRTAPAIFGDLYVVDWASGVQRSLGAIPFVQDSPAWSPDGNLIAFVSTHHGQSDLYTISPDGKRVARRTYDTEVEARPTWIARPATVR